MMDVLATRLWISLSGLLFFDLLSELCRVALVVPRQRHWNA